MAKLSSDGKSVTVEKGDTLSAIARDYGNGKTYQELATLNNIQNPDLIYPGQTIKLSGTADPVAANTTSRVTINAFGLQASSDRTVFATWTWSKDNTEHYQCIWYYDTGDGVWFVGSDTTEKHTQSVYNAPSNAKRVKFKVKPVSKTHTVNNKETSYWTGSWATPDEKKFSHPYDFSNNPPSVPPVPTVTLEKYTITAEVSNLNVNADQIQFQLVPKSATFRKNFTATIKYNYASFSTTVAAGDEYMVRCRSVKGKANSAWSEYSAYVGTVPNTPTKITSCKAKSETSVYLEWEASTAAETYDIEYTTKKDYFDSSNQVTPVNGVEYTHYEVTGLETGEEYFFRVRAVNEKGESGWTDPVSVAIGKEPAAPTTWSSSTKVAVGEPLNLYWVHNSADESSQTFAELELDINGVVETHTIKNSEEEDEKDKTSVYAIDTNKYTEGMALKWRVRTAGVTLKYGDWSVQRTIDVHAPAVLALTVTDLEKDDLEVLTSFPFYINAVAGPSNQTPIGYHLAVISNEVYETVDNVGNVKMVNKGETVYSKYFNTDDELMVTMSAQNINLENGVEYTVSCTVSMDTGLKASAEATFSVSWTDEMCEPNAEIAIDKDTLAAYIRAYCEDASGNLNNGITLSVYRREFDGRFTELATGLSNTSMTFITDPHPALDYARYRIVAITDSTGAVSYCDIPGHPVGEVSAVIQWDETWSSFNQFTDDAFEQPPWSGSMLKLPYNIDVSDNHKPDVANVEYIGRSHPISYYGTQLGVTSTWSMAIEKDDEETLYALRRLARWMGDVYVREPSGSGYWANIVVSFSQKHCDVIIPVTLDITRVEGGV